MIRSDLVDVLSRVAPALSTKDFVPVFSCLCFNGKTVTAYDDVVAMSMPLAWDVKGALKGATLLGWMNASRAAEIECTQEGEQVNLKAGRSKLNLPVLPESAFAFSFPEDQGVEIDVSGGFLDGVEKCLVSMGGDPSRPWQAGITVVFDQDAAFLFSTNNTAASKVKVKFKGMKAKTPDVLLLPPRFCELLATIGGKDQVTTLILGKGWAEARFASKLRLFTRTGKDADVDAFNSVFSAETAAVGKKVMPLPKGFDSCIDRCMVILEGSRERLTKFTVADGKGIVYTTSSMGEVKDNLRMDGHPDVTVECSPDAVKKVLPFVTDFFVTDNFVLFKGTAFTHLVSTAKES